MLWLQELIPKNEQCTGDRKKGVFDARNGPVDVESCTGATVFYCFSAKYELRAKGSEMTHAKPWLCAVCCHHWNFSGVT